MENLEEMNKDYVEITSIIDGSTDRYPSLYKKIKNVKEMDKLVNILVEKLPKIIKDMEKSDDVFKYSFVLNKIIVKKCIYERKTTIFDIKFCGFCYYELDIDNPNIKNYYPYTYKTITKDMIEYIESSEKIYNLS